MSMEDQIKKVLGTTKFKPTGQCGGGCINQGESYDTDNGRVFVKLNFKDGAKQMFEGEFASLSAIRATKTIRVPKPLHVVSAETGQGAALVMEALNMTSSGRHQMELGRKLASLHNHNRTLIEKKHPSAVQRFGFHLTTCCGFLPLDNSWKDDWIDFYIKNRIEPQIMMLETKDKSTGIRDLWTKVEQKLPDFFENVTVVPALLHGDLWSGNKAELDKEPVIFDPGSFYGHSEFDFGIIQMFGGFEKKFFEGYHSISPKQSGFEKRCDLYELFHHLNHWNHFGSGYKKSSIELLKKLAC